ncbi:hypothetical protein H6G17_18250 [Chroococcidiopsis sp. FACHB-1243]|uniref:hypothetical protein n=1 Tax=Chroococcidiopsis sp. [FACHB-1243] TaxID=2692781 RepID=UPI00178562EC|nr:hypothetical protein [Chroococcidiopsis sp. [FACHB-1243]]MBD2307419.1 hypothetical protein [Chroococcidiopsis sp. [FACHB-1243]]
MSAQVKERTTIYLEPQVMELLRKRAAKNQWSLAHTCESLLTKALKYNPNKPA